MRQLLSMFIGAWVVVLLSLLGCGEPPPLEEVESTEELSEENSSGGPCHGPGCPGWQGGATANTAAGPGCPQPVPCVEGARRCSADGMGVEACGRFETGCVGWTAPVACEGGGSCEMGACQAPTCANGCTVGEKRCDAGGGGVQHCAQDELGCASWSSPRACGQGAVCEGAGVCAAPGSGCMDSCQTEHEIKCSSNSEYRCTRGAEGCLQWSFTGNTCTQQGGGGGGGGGLGAPCVSLTYQQAIDDGACIKLSPVTNSACGPCSWERCENGQFVCIAGTQNNAGAPPAGFCSQQISTSYVELACLLF